MELTGLQIFKHLPAAKKAENTNCKKCGCSTCMAYALKLAKKQVNIDACPFIPLDLKALLENASKIQQHEIQLSDTIKAGGETVMFRHEKTFVNHTVIAVALDTTDKNFDKKLEKIKEYSIERIGETYKIDAVYLTGSVSDGLRKDLQKANIAIISGEEHYRIITGRDVCELEVKAQDLIKKDKVKDIVFDLEYSDSLVEQLTYIRRASILNRHEPLTYPVMVKIPEWFNLLETCALASLLICRYANIIVLNEFDEAMISTLMTLRQNIYTNPQKPLQVEAKVYEFNDPNRYSPILLTTNFALTYFAVAGELESMSQGSYLVVVPSDGMSVLTAWSADKFTAELVAKSINNFNLKEKVDTRTIIIPGLLSHMKTELQEALPEWQIVVGTVEACQIPEFLNKGIVS